MPVGRVRANIGRVAPLSPMDLPPNVPTSYVLIALVVGVLPVIISTFNALLSIIAWFRKSPPVHEVYATKAELRAMEGRIVSQIQEHGSNTDEVEERLDGKITAIEERLVHQLDQGQTLFNSIQKELNSLAQATAELRGRVSSLPTQNPKR